MSQKPFYITTAIAYGNAAPHIGFFGLEVIPADCLARFARLYNRPTYFLTGMDEHGQKIEQTATKQGLTPQALVDKTSSLFREVHQQFAISYDDFIRTTEPRHKQATQKFWQKLQEQGDIYKANYSGWYSVRDEAYFDEAELTTNEQGKKFAPTGAPVEWMEEESYFFKLSAYADKLLELYENNPNWLQPSSRRNEVVAFVKSGLKDLSISRTSISWGIPVPGDEKHVMYVWIDALANYITALGYPEATDKMAQFWPQALHIIGKDIVRFHAIYWPAFLMSAGLPLPARIFGHGFVTIKGEKMSKSLGNVIAPTDIVQLYGLDAVRYFFLREVAFGQDGSFSHEGLMNRTNADLANDLGNLAQRSLSMIAKNCGGTVPLCGALLPDDEALLTAAKALKTQVQEHIDALEIHRAVEAIWRVIADTNQYFANMAPWGLKKSDPARMATVLYVTAEVLRRVCLLAQPIVPVGAAKLLNQLSVPETARTMNDWDSALVAGTALPEPSGAFPRYQPPENQAAES